MKLMPYQIEGADFLSKRRFAFLADGMGLGKSAQAIEACNVKGYKKIVVICPAVARINWAREFEMWRKHDMHIFIESFDTLARRVDISKKIIQMEPDVLILDEAHYLKNRTAKRTLAVYGKYCYGKGIASAAKNVWLLSGTPCPNDAGELWPHLRALWPELITIGDSPLNYISFLQRYCVLQDTPFGPKILGNKNKDELRSILKQILLRRKAEDVLLDLPPISWHMVPVEPIDVMDDIAKMEHEPAVMALMASLTEETDLESMMVAMASLRRATGVAKAKLAGRMIADEIDSGAYNKIVVFYQHTEVGKTLIANLEKYGVVSISGSTTNTMRQKAIDTFQADPSVRVFIGQLQACSTAITLHAASQVMFVEQSWTPADNAQAAKRCHRIGQKSPVFVRMLGLAKSIDEAVTKVLARKSQMISELMEEV